PSNIRIFPSLCASEIWFESIKSPTLNLNSFNDLPLSASALPNPNLLVHPRTFPRFHAFSAKPNLPNLSTSPHAPNSKANSLSCTPHLLPSHALYTSTSSLHTDTCAAVYIPTPEQYGTPPHETV